MNEERADTNVVGLEWTRTLSNRVWELDWRAHLPWEVCGVHVEAGTFRGDAAPFVAEHYATIFGTAEEPARFHIETSTEAKRRFGDEMDVLRFRDGDRTVGILLGHPLDWSTYYFRSVAFLPAYRDRGLLGGTLERAYDALARAGVERVEGECSPTNGPMMRALVKLGYVATATVASERWGMTVRFTKYLKDGPRDVFSRQFCAVRTEGS